MEPEEVKDDVLAYLDKKTRDLTPGQYIDVLSELLEELQTRYEAADNR